MRTEIEDNTSETSSRTHSGQGMPVSANALGRPSEMHPCGRRGEDASYPDVCVHELFEKQVARDPKAVAVQYLDQTMSYEELNSRAEQIARHLRSRGVRPGALVGVCAPRCPDLVASLLACWKAGAAYVPLDPTYPPERLRFMVEDSHISCVLTMSAQADLFDDRVSAILLDSAWADHAEDLEARPVDPSALAYVMYTSGSTGKPKGAMITHRGLVNYLWWAIKAYRVQAGCSVPVHSSIAFDLTVTSLYPALLVGGSIELLPESFGGQELIEAMRRNKHYALVKITPAHLEMVTQELTESELPGSTDALVIGGENLRAEILDRWRRFAPETRIFNEYGPTETVVGCCVHLVTPDDSSHASVPIGRPIANTQLYILDSALRPVPDGLVGELYIGGDGVARGYFNRPELTAERFLPDSFTSRPGARLYKTGDLVKMGDDGIMLYLGRVDHQVKIRGFRVELGEIEHAALEHPDVQSCTVIADSSQDNLPFLIAFAIPRAGSLASETLRGFMAARIPDHMLPQRFIFLDQFPLTNNGKVDREALVTLARSSSVPPSDDMPSVTGSAAALTHIWCDLLGREHVGIDDDVFTLGAHSLLIARAVTRIRRELGVDVQLRHIFEHPTVAGQSDLVEKLLWSASAASPTQTEDGREEIEI